ncbi:MAG: zf-HC2 domain-containing protein [Opitutaceae bacterium]
MNCRAAQRLLSAERDSPLGTPERADLEAHLAGCGECRRARVLVAAAVDRWRNSSAAIAVPDAERAWQDIRREIRTTAPGDARDRRTLPRWTLPLTAAAALVIAAIAAPRWFGDSTPSMATHLAVARADFVETPQNTSSMVYVDDKSGWLVVWAVTDNDKL